MPPRLRPGDCTCVRGLVDERGDRGGRQLVINGEAVVAVSVGAEEEDPRAQG
jgi:hypothetical protein